MPVAASIIVCTHNRAARLNALLASLAAMSGVEDIDYEVIVVDNRSDDSTRETVASWRRQLPISYCYEAQPGISHARNTGLAASRGQYILFTDDDCVVAANWLATGVRLLSDAPLQIIGGRIDLHDDADRPLTIKVEQHPAAFASAGELLGFLHGCNMIFGRCVVDRVGLFDPLLGAGTLCKAADDTDFVYRAFKRHVPISYRPELRLAHNHGRRCAADEDKLVSGYVLSIGALAFKYVLRGDLTVLKLAYWRLRSDHGAKRKRVVNYLRGCAGYGYQMLRRRLKRCGRAPKLS